MVKEAIVFISEVVNGRLLVGVENNSIGSAIIENLENASSKNILTPDQMEGEIFDYSSFLYVEDKSKDAFAYGINTNTKTKDQMVSVFYDYIVNEPELISSSNLIEQFSVIEKRSNGSISAKSGQHDDLFMASCLCAYMKKQTILDSSYLKTNDTIKGKLNDEFDSLLRNVVQNERINNSEAPFNIFASEIEDLKSIDEDDFVL